MIYGIISQLQEGWGDFRAIAFIAGFVFLLSISACNYGRMNEQEVIKTYETALPEAPQETIPVSGGVQVLRTTEPKNLKNPFPYAEESVDQGSQAYSYFCMQCHGPKADGHGPVGQSFAPLPSNLVSPEVQKQGDGELFYKISLGFGRHPPLASTVSEEDRWAVINYLRSLNKKSGT